MDINPPRVAQTMLKLIRDSVGILQNTVEYQPVLFNHNTSTIINFEIFNAKMRNHYTGRWHVTGRGGGIDSESASKRKENRAEKNEQQQIKATGIEKQLNLKQCVWC